MQRCGGVWECERWGRGVGVGPPPPPAQYAEPTLLPFCPPRLRATLEGLWVGGADVGEEAADVTAGDPPPPITLTASSQQYGGGGVWIND